MGLNHGAIAEAIIIEDNPDMGSLQHLATSLGAVAGGVAGLKAGETVATLVETTTETTVPTDHEAEMGAGFFAGAALLGAAAYLGVRHYAIHALGRDRYQEIKQG